MGLVGDGVDGFERLDPLRVDVAVADDPAPRLGRLADDLCENRMFKIRPTWLLFERIWRERGREREKEREREREKGESVRETEQR